MKIQINELNEIAELYKNGRSLTNICNEYKRDRKMISKWLKDQGVAIKLGNFLKRGVKKSYNSKFENGYVINDETNCWEWQKGKNKRGYGQFWKDEAMVGAHRYSYMHYKGEIQKGMLVCHTCDNPGCVNPEHLFLGTHKDNMQDKVKKGRMIAGGGIHKCIRLKKLSTESLSKIQELRENGMLGTLIAKKFNISVRGLYQFLKDNNIYKK